MVKQRRSTGSNKTANIIAFVSILLVLLNDASAIQQQQQQQEDNQQEESEPPNLRTPRFVNPSSSAGNGAYYQPALIGFRCETVRDVTPDGVSVIEANTPVTLTLYGESFTANTIVAFTTEFHPDLDAPLHPSLLSHTPIVADETRSQALVATTTTEQPAAATTTSTTSTASTATTTTASIGANSSSGQALALTIAQQTGNSSSNGKSTVNRKFANRRRFKSNSYDCTDYNRVTSYRLTEDNILSPNVATLTVTLPELDSGSGMYYYFCLKQPQLSASSSTWKRSLQRVDPAAGAGGEYNESSQQEQPFVWVHQGDEWWVTLKVEPPILSIANDCVLILLLLFLSAVTSGLNLGLMSLDMNELAVISSCGDQRERSYARTIAPLRKRGNYLLCALLLGNVMVNSTLTVILEEMTSGVVAVIGSTLAIVVLGEIVPQAFCARQGLAIGAKTIYLTYAFMLLTFPLSYPISCLLDCVLGEEKGNVYDRERLMEFIKITGHHTQLEADEVAIISGALKLKKIKVDQIMTRIEDVFMLPIDCKLDRDTIRRIIEKGYSRIPVYEFDDRKQIVALILAKDLALLDPDDHTPIANMLMYCKHPLIFIDDDTTLDVALNEFKTGKSHMAVVRQIYDDGDYDKYYEAIGVVTLEDVIEEVLQVEINDETDTLSDNRRKRRRTDAQVAHHIDELASVANSASTTGAKFDCELGLGTGGAGATEHGYEPSLSNKMVQTSLSSHLTSVSVGGLARSLAQSSTPSGVSSAKTNTTPMAAAAAATVASAALKSSPIASHSSDPVWGSSRRTNADASRRHQQHVVPGSRSTRSHSVELPSGQDAKSKTTTSSNSSNQASQRQQEFQSSKQADQQQQQRHQLSQSQLMSQVQLVVPQEAAGGLISRAAQFLSNIIR